MPYRPELASPENLRPHIFRLGSWVAAVAARHFNSEGVTSTSDGQLRWSHERNKSGKHFSLDYNHSALIVPDRPYDLLRITYAEESIPSLFFRSEVSAQSSAPFRRYSMGLIVEHDGTITMQSCTEIGEDIFEENAPGAKITKMEVFREHHPRGVYGPSLNSMRQALGSIVEHVTATSQDPGLTERDALWPSPEFDPLVNDLPNSA